MTLWGSKIIANMKNMISLYDMKHFHSFWCFVFQDPNWYKAKNAAGCEGTIPANYVQKREGVKSGGKLSLMP